MNIIQQQGEQTIDILHPSKEEINALVRKTGQQIGRFAKAMAVFFARRHPVSSLRVVWAGVLRSDRERLIPEPSEEVRFQVANQMFLCEEGKPLVFDDSWNREAWDQMNGYRVVFLTDSLSGAKEPLRQRLHQFITRLVRR